jgi:hypothetical protein
MLDLNALFEFSRNHCGAICAFLVPANLLATLWTLGLVAFRGSPKLVTTAVLLASGFAGLMALHVGTWFMVGVVMPPTFILSALSITCLLINGWAIANPGSLNRFLTSLLALLKVRHPQLPQS